MATYTVKTPDGGTLQIEGPENAPQEQVLQAAARLYESYKDRGIVSSAVGAVGSTIAGAGRIAEDITGLGTGLKEVGQKIERDYGQTAGLDQPLEFAQQTAGSAVGSAGQAYAGGAAGAGVGMLIAGPPGAAVGGLVGALTPGFVSSYEGIRKVQDETGQENIPLAIAGATAATALEKFIPGISKTIIKRVTPSVVGAAERGVLKPLAKDVVGEATVETLQQGIERGAGGKEIFAAPGEYAAAAVGGGLGGGVIKGLDLVIPGKKQTGDVTPPPPTLTPQQYEQILPEVEPLLTTDPTTQELVAPSGIKFNSIQDAVLVYSKDPKSFSSLVTQPTKVATPAGMQSAEEILKAAGITDPDAIKTITKEMETEKALREKEASLTDSIAKAQNVLQGVTDPVLKAQFTRSIDKLTKQLERVQKGITKIQPTTTTAQPTVTEEPTPAINPYIPTMFNLGEETDTMLPRVGETVDYGQVGEVAQAVEASREAAAGSLGEIPTAQQVAEGKAVREDQDMSSILDFYNLPIFGAPSEDTDIGPRINQPTSLEAASDAAKAAQEARTGVPTQEQVPTQQQVAEGLGGRRGEALMGPDKITGQRKAAATGPDKVAGKRAVFAAGPKKSKTKDVSFRRTGANLNEKVDGFDLNTFVTDFLQKKGLTNNAPVVIINTFSEAPANAIESDRKQREGGAQGSPAAFYNPADGKVYLVRDQIGNADLAAKAILEESLGHYGMRETFGNNLNKIWDDTYLAKKAEVDAIAAQYGLKTETLEGRRQATDEYLAKLATEEPNSTIITRLVKKIREILRSWGMNLNLSKSEIIENFIIPARNHVKNKNAPTFRRYGGAEGLADTATQFMYTGEKAKQTGPAIENLSEAADLEKQGYSQEEIRDRTGWFRGLDKKWRLEISDDGASFTPAFSTIPVEFTPNSSYGITLDRILDHPQLFQMYPDLRKVGFMVGKGLSGMRGSFSPDNNLITLYADQHSSTDSMMETILHEVQHWIQKKEGFARGGSPQRAYEMLSSKQKSELRASLIERAKVEARILTYRLNTTQDLMESPKFADYLSSLEKFNIARESSKFSKDEKLKFMNQHTKAVNDLVATKTDPFDQEHMKDALASLRYRLQTRKATDILPTMQQEINEVKNGIDAMSAGSTSAVYKELERTGQGYTLYTRIAGEIEAEDTAKRRNLPLEERLSLTPQSMKTKDAIIGYYSGETSESASLDSPMFMRVQPEGLPPTTSRDVKIKDTIGKAYRFFFEGEADRLLRNPITAELGDALRNRVDMEQANKGKFNSKMGDAYKTYKDLNITQRKKVDAELEKLFKTLDRRHNDLDGTLKGVSPEAKNIFLKTRAALEQADKMNIDSGLMVRGADGKYQPYKGSTHYFPRYELEKYRKALADPYKYPVEYNEIVNGLLQEGYIKNKEAAARYLNNYVTYRNNPDFFGSLEAARKFPLPEFMYDYSLDTINKYRDLWANRLAQISAYGQGRGPNGKDLFQTTVEDVRLSPKDKERVNAIREMEYYNMLMSERHRLFAQISNPFNTLATGLQLANPLTAGRNFVGGSAMTAEVLGNRNFLKAAHEYGMRKDKHEVDLVAAGVITNDMFRIQADIESRNLFEKGPLKSAQTFSSALTNNLMGYKFLDNIPGLKVMQAFSFDYTEQVNRAIAGIASRYHLSDLVKVMTEKAGSQADKSARRRLKQEGLDPDKLIAESSLDDFSSMPETQKYMRRMVGLAQGTYQLDNTPLWVNTPAGRLMFKYWKFGTQITRLVDRKIVQLIMSSDRQERFEGWRNLARFVMMMTAAGLIDDRLRESVAGYISDIPEHEEIEAAVERGDSRTAMLRVFDTVVSSLLSIGAFGVFGNLMEKGQRWVKYGDEELFTFPAFAPVKSIFDAFNLARQQGTLTADDVNKIFEQNISLYRVSSRLAKKVLGMNDMEVNDPVESMTWQAMDVTFMAKVQLEEVKRKRLQSLIQRYADDRGIDADINFTQRFDASENTPFNRAIFRALLIGDSVRANKLFNESLARAKTKGEKEKIIASLQTSVRRRAPAAIPNNSGYLATEDFFQWAKENTSEDNYKAFLELDNRYYEAATKAGILPRRNVSKLRADELKKQRKADRPVSQAELMIRGQ